MLNQDFRKICVDENNLYEKRNAGVAGKMQSHKREKIVEDVTVYVMLAILIFFCCTTMIGLP